MGEEISKRNINLDILKVMSMFAAILIHAISFYIQAPIKSLIWKYFIVVGSSIRFCIPVFLMCTGALLYKKEVTKGKVKRNVYKFVKLLILWDIIYRVKDTITQYILKAEVTNLKTHILQMLSGNNKYHLYYLYIIIGIYLLAPIIQKTLSNLTKQELRYFITILLISCVLIPTVQWIGLIRKIKILNLLQSGIAITFIVYTILGYYISENIQDFSKKIGIFMTIIGTVGMAYGTYKLSIYSNETNTIFWELQNVVLLTQSVGIFIVAHHIKIKERVEKYITNISKNTLYIYLSHVMIIDILSLVQAQLLNMNWILKMLYPFIATIVILLLTNSVINLIVKRR